MLCKRQYDIKRHISGQSISKKVIEDNIKDSFLGLHYGGIGLIQNFSIQAIGLFEPTIDKRSVSKVPVRVNFDMFCIPSGFIISNATLIKIRSENNNTTYLFNCKFYDVEGNSIFSNEITVAGKKASGIIGTMITMGKSAETLNRYKFLAEGERVNLVSIMPLPNDGKQFMMFNCDLIAAVDAKYFKYNSSMDLTKTAKLAVKDKVNYPLFSKHAEVINKLITTDLVEGTIYAMTIYGFHEASDANPIDFIREQSSAEITNSNTQYEVALGFDTLSNYLYYTMYNWRCAIEGLKHD